MRSSVFLCAVFGLALSPVALAVANELEKQLSNLPQMHRSSESQSQVHA